MKNAEGLCQRDPFISRGKTIDTSNSNNLKQFIFGTEKIKENRKKYEDALKDFTDTIFNYNQT